MTAPVVTKRPALFLVPLLAGSLVAIALGVYASEHTPSGHALYLGPFRTMIGLKVWLTVVALALALVQLVTALWMYGKLGVRAPGWAGGLHKTTGALAFLVTLPVAFHCLWALGFYTGDARVLAHSLLGCVFYGAFVAKVLTLHSKRMPGWALPWVGGALFTVLIGVGLTSAVWYFAKVGVPS
jgi:hypothetical protein